MKSQHSAAGDAVDKGPGDIRVVKTLLSLKRRYWSRASRPQWKAILNVNSDGASRVLGFPERAAMDVMGSLQHTGLCKVFIVLGNRDLCSSAWDWLSFSRASSAIGSRQAALLR